MSFSSMLMVALGMTLLEVYLKKLSNAKDDFAEHLYRRLENVTIENRDALEIIACYDNPDTFHFVDPPYVNSDCGHYEESFNEQIWSTCCSY